MDYKKVEINSYETKPVFAGACGDFTSSCGAANHNRDAHGACGDYTSSCGAANHNRDAYGVCGDYTSSCGTKNHNRQ